MRSIILLTVLLFPLYATQILLTQEQQKDWQIEDMELKSEPLTPQASLYVEVITPPRLLKTISVPHSVVVDEIYVDLYEHVDTLQPIVSVSSTQWLQIQQEAIANSIELAKTLKTYRRKELLCKEQIVAQKECIASKATLDEVRNRVKASRGLLAAYGATKKMISAIIDRYRVFSSLTLHSSSAGSVTQIKARAGQSIDAFATIATIQSDGELWLEGALSAQKAALLKKGERVFLQIGSKKFASKVLALAPFINSKNQTRVVRLLLAEDSDLLAGYRASATLYKEQDSIKVAKNAVVQHAGKSTIFIKIKEGYESLGVDVLAQDSSYYYLAPNKELLGAQVAISSVLILKSMMDNSDE